MELSQVLQLLEKNQNARGIEHWNKLKNQGGLASYGLGLTALRKLAKQIGKNRELSKTLWASDIYDAKVLGLLLDDPKKITKEQAEQQVDNLNAGMLSHVFSSCDATLAKSPIAFDTAQQWLDSSDSMRRRCAFGLAYELSKKKSKIYTDEFFLSVIEDIDTHFDNEGKAVRLAMGGALLGIGKRNAVLHKACLSLAKKIGPIDFNEDGQNCAPLDVVKHLTSPALLNKFATN